ncbi:2-dehydropantoate 2-reductase [Paenibacillus sp. GP183]|uniref:ketopantoate reductase family protein n=1 Tax=Paenibacillus sp. GP183 TaxID=1882751 RepID=UPI0008997B66|nr:2-dehydropantoate 2-reductase [Paenibacillus sp. GP183]SEB41573.1 2-dehydropantoate 2-reductase [Paenibacillus sp. GP183]
MTGLVLLYNLLIEQEGDQIMHIAVMGAGSIGLLLAARLSAVTDTLEIITRTEEQADAIRREGISVEEESIISADKFEVISYETKIAKRKASHDLQFLVLAVKQFAINNELVAFILRYITPHTTIICFQNGMGHVDKLLAHLDKERILLAVTTEGARKTGLYQVSHTGSGITDLGYSFQDIGENAENAQKIFAGLMKRAGFEVSLSKNMGIKVWSKLIINAVINPLTAILKIRNGELLQTPSSKALMLALFSEGIAVARANQLDLPDELWETVLQVCKLTADNQSSMLQDIIHSRSTEIDSINGTLLRIAEQHKLVLPVNQVVFHMIKALENKKVSDIVGDC